MALGGVRPQPLSPVDYVYGRAPALTGTGKFTISPPGWVKDKLVDSQEVRYTECDVLSPALPRSLAVAEHGRTVITKALGDRPDNGGMLIVGHMPQLNWLAYLLTRGFGGRWWKPWERAALPPAGGEVACLAVTGRGERWSGRALWLIPGLEWGPLIT